MSDCRQLIEHPDRYRFIEAYQLVAMALQRQHLLSPDRIRVTPLLDLNYPRCEVAEVQLQFDQQQQPFYAIKVNLMGLYGSLSPLPKFFSEELIQGATRDERGAQLFLDLIHQHLYRLLYKAKTQYLPHYFDADTRDNQSLLLALGGIDQNHWYKAFPKPQFIIRNINIFRYQRGTSLGLKQLLKGLFDAVEVNVQEFCRRRVSVPRSQQSQLSGSRGILNQTAMLGNRLDDRHGSLVVEIIAISQQQFNYWVMSSEHWHSLNQLVTQFLGEPLIVWLRFQVQMSNNQPQGFQQLGKNTWLAASTNSGPTRMAKVRLC